MICTKFESLNMKSSETIKNIGDLFLIQDETDRQITVQRQHEPERASVIKGCYSKDSNQSNTTLGQHEPERASVIKGCYSKDSNQSNTTLGQHEPERASVIKGCYSKDSNQSNTTLGQQNRNEPLSSKDVTPKTQTSQTQHNIRTK